MGALGWLARRLIYPGILGGSALGVALLSERVSVVVAMGVVNVLARARPSWRWRRRCPTGGCGRGCTGT